MDDFALEELRPHLDDSVRVRLAFNQPPKELVLPQELLSLQEVDPQNPLMMKEQDGKRNIYHIYDDTFPVVAQLLLSTKKKNIRLVMEEFVVDGDDEEFITDLEDHYVIDRSRCHCMTPPSGSLKVYLPVVPSLYNYAYSFYSVVNQF